MKIAFIGLKGIPAKWGGIETYIEEIGSRLSARGHEVTVYSSKWYCSDYHENEYKGMCIKRVPTIHLQATDALTNAMYSALAIARSNSDIVHCHGFASFYFIPIFKLLNKAVVITIHAMESNWDNIKYSSIGRMVIKTAFTRGVNGADAITTVAEHLKSKISRDYQRDSELVPSGIMLNEKVLPDLIKKKYKLYGDDYVLFLGRIDPIKRVEWVLYLDTEIGHDMHIVIAGGSQDDKTNAYYESLRDRAKEKQNIIFTGPVYGQEKKELLSNCSLFISASKDEGFPIALLEAASYGACCVASDIAAHKSIICHNKTGYLFNKGEKNALIDTVRAVMNQKADVRRRIGEEIKGEVINKYSWDITVDKLEDIYSKLLNSKSRKKVV